MVIVNSQRGYTMVLFLAFIAAVLLAGMALYDSSTVATERIKMQNTADATAFSTINVITRDMNFIAYTNRAMVANQVAIGQAVGLSSWIHMISDAAKGLDNVGSAVSWVPYVGQVIKKVTSAVKKAAKASKKGIDVGAKVFSGASDIAIGVISGSQRAFQLATVDMAKSTYSGVAKANDPHIETNLLIAGASLATLLSTWDDNIEYYSNPQNGQKGSKFSGRWRIFNLGKKSDNTNIKDATRYAEFAQIVNSSRDRFTENRNFNWMDMKRFKPAGVGGGIIKAGGSDFRAESSGKNIKWQWTSMDTVSLWGSRYRLQKKGFKSRFRWKDREVLKFGGGAAHAGTKNYYNYVGNRNSRQLAFYNEGRFDRQRSRWNLWGDGSHAFHNKKSAFAAHRKDNRNNLYQARGLRPFHDLKTNEKKDTGPSLVALLSKSSGGLRLQKTLDAKDKNYNRPKSMQIEEHGGLQKNKLYGLAKAQTYFSRPADLWQRKDKRREYGNLYNPFWQTRLVDTTDKERSAALLAAGFL